MYVVVVAFGSANVLRYYVCRFGAILFKDIPVLLFVAHMLFNRSSVFCCCVSDALRDVRF